MILTDLLQSKLASFLGDPSFPTVALKYSQGAKIHFYQDLYKQYSRMVFSHQQDRPIAIAGLESRLIQTLQVRGGFGVLEDQGHGLLRRSLLWKRASDVSALERIAFVGVGGVKSAISPPPTWSWTGYQGAIEYLDIPFGRIDWEKGDICSPWPSGARGTWSYGGDVHGRGLELRVIARDFKVCHVDAIKGIVFDDPRTWELGSELKCVVLGSLKAPAESYLTRPHYVLVVAAEGIRPGQVYGRVGVGSLPGHLIDFDQPGTPGKVH